ncbi:conserved hypothetical protein [Anaeromyxobacter dehalogenans 2CP-1]|uniref:Lipoprotein n=1 Tax=Anaeromyxobacter dehalogenans (strain ATCC BAA-258 / DSM 21875 / 2CP-1) TaxID=455488 RepID=B8J8V4_ANAD2|nr:hypothetical protein [Anaeromyxobacter dehalogenans]ACL63552.1 conserved hypothetical protein [Anaeromyxobacter dehalogenans 2CP-1]
MRRLALAALALSLASACASREALWRYREEGTFGDGAPPLHAEPIGGGAEYRLVSASLGEADLSLERSVAALGDAPVRVDLGRVRLRSASGEELPLVRACLLEATPRCAAGGASRGFVATLSPGEVIRFRADFGPVDVLGPDRAPNPEVLKVTLAEEGVYVGGRLQPVTVVLEKVPAR